jgi:RNA polymerase sigma-70 factor (ECF subfamily)
MSLDERTHDQALMERVGQGDEDALAELYDRWAKPLLNFLYRMCRDRTLSEDLLQDVFLRVWRAAPRYRPLAKFSTWLFQIARNHWLNEREKIMRRIRPVSLDKDVSRSGEGGVGLKNLVAGDGPEPDETALDRELGERIDDAASQLPEKLRSVWVLGAAQGLPYAQVAEILGIPVGTVKSRMFQAVRQLRVELAPYAES